jgi:predicted DNA-binding transcriptional regulator AlpA
MFDKRQVLTETYDRVILSWRDANSKIEGSPVSTEVIHTSPTAADILLMEEVSELTRIPLSTLRFYRHSHQGPKSFKLGGRVCYKRGDVLAWIEAQYNGDGGPTQHDHKQQPPSW